MATSITFHGHACSGRRQSGAVLAIALVLLLALTILGVAALSANKLQTRLAYSASESTLAFQSAESALAAGEIWLAAQTVPPVPGCVAADVPACPTNTAVWDKTLLAGTATLDNLLSATWWSSNGRQYGFSYVDGITPAVQTGQAIPEVAEVPKYIVQYLGKNQLCSADPTVPCNSSEFYEVSARGTGKLNENNTVVQSVYAVRF